MNQAEKSGDIWDGVVIEGPSEEAVLELRLREVRI